MIDYTWVAWFEELAGKIAREGEDYLIRRARRVDWRRDDPPLLAYGDENIDPMSFLYFLAQRNTSNQYKPVFESVTEEFEITSVLSQTPPTIPTPVPNAAALFHDGKSFDPGLLWSLFRDAVQTDKASLIKHDDFEAALAFPQVGIRKLTQTLFLANPRYFLPVDILVLGRALSQSAPRGQMGDYGDYIKGMDALKGQFPECEAYEIHGVLWNGGSLFTREPRFFQVGTNVHATERNYWEWTADLPPGLRTFKENNCVYTGGPGNQKKFPLDEPKRGDVILVRTGTQQGRAIGVVEENEYRPDGWSEQAVIYVHWINKATAPVEGNLPQIAFGNAGERTISAFRNADAYKVSFDLIYGWTGNDSVGAQPDPGSLAEESEMSFFLNTILFGPPGTGKTWEAVSHAVAIMDGKDPAILAQAEDRRAVKARFTELREEERVEFVTFHQNYAYEDFMEGIGPVLDQDELRYEIRHGVFKRISSHAREHPNERHVLIIDEINRGNIAKIFGELITLIEPSKRSGGEDEAVVTLPYSQDSFSVPGNLYLVGTMNTADRGIALLDTALRRRFDFIEKMPDVSFVERDIEGVDGRDMLKAMNERITACLDREHQIGHTYLIGVKAIDGIDGLAEVFQRRIVPLLQEYFYDDWAKIQFVLGDSPFVGKCEVETSIQDASPERPVFELLAQSDEKWKQAESYRQIYLGKRAEEPD